MSSPLEDLLAPAAPDARRRALETFLAAPDGPEQLERALPDLLRDPDEPLLVALAEGLGGRDGDAAARRVLEVLARRPGPARAPALRGLRGGGA